MRAAGGRVELSDRRPEDPPLPDELQVALREWAAFAATVPAGTGGRLDRSGASAELVQRRGRQLALRVARVRGRPVEYQDPVSGDVESVRAPAAPDAPLPWGTGLAVAAFFAVLVGLGDVVLSRTFAGAFGLWWLPANLVVCGGLTPSLWLLRTVPFWRWPALGVATGLAAAWVVLLAGLLGPGVS